MPERESQREWKTEGEIRSIVHEEMRDALHAQTAILEKQNITLDKIADGAQAQMLSIQILHGNEELGLKGVLPELQERMEAVENDVAEMRRSGDERRRTDDDRFATLEGHLDRLESNQGRFRKTLKRVCEAVTTDEKGKTDYKKVIGVGTAIYAALHVIFGHLKEIWQFILKTIMALRGWGI